MAAPISRAWNYSPAPSQIAGGMWDDVPLASPIPNLAGDGPFNPREIHCSNTKRRTDTATLSWGSGPIRARSAWPKPETGTHAISTSRGSGTINTGRHRASGT